jgi:predicted molibdopterin-dependent oxidoreductase YjgC
VDADKLSIREGDTIDVATPRGAVTAKARVTGIRTGVLFIPFHYGYWDADNVDHHRAANELTLTDWDPVSKQPLFKTAAARLRRVSSAAECVAAPAPTNTASAPLAIDVPPTIGGPVATAGEAVDEVSS